MRSTLSMRGAELASWGFSLTLHLAVLWPLLAQGTAEPAQAAPSAAAPLELVAELVPTPEPAPPEPLPRPVQTPPPLELAAAEREAPEDAPESFDPGASSAEPPSPPLESRPLFADSPAHEPQVEPLEADAAAPTPSRDALDEGRGSQLREVSEDAIRALHLQLSVGDPDEFLEAARWLGLRFLVYPAQPEPEWMLEVSGTELERVSEVDDALLSHLSRRAQNLSAQPYFRAVRDRVARERGIAPVGVLIVAAVPGGTDRQFLDAERAFLQEYDGSVESLRRLRGRLVRTAEGGWRLEITDAS